MESRSFWIRNWWRISILIVGSVLNVISLTFDISQLFGISPTFMVVLGTVLLVVVIISYAIPLEVVTPKVIISDHGVEKKLENYFGNILPSVQNAYIEFRNDPLHRSPESSVQNANAKIFFLFKKTMA